MVVAPPLTVAVAVLHTATTWPPQPRLHLCLHSGQGVVVLRRGRGMRGRTAPGRRVAPWPTACRTLVALALGQELWQALGRVQGQAKVQAQAQVQ